MTRSWLVFCYLFVIFVSGLCQNDCGIIERNSIFKSRQYPWSVAIFNKSFSSSAFICGGTLVTKNLIVTAAHCIQKKQQTQSIETSDLRIELQDSKGETLLLTPTRVEVHPEWNINTPQYDADIAIIEIANEFPNSIFIPICLWTSSDPYPEFTDGYVTEWIADGDKLISKQYKVSKQLNEYCFLDEPIFDMISSKRTFCGGSKRGIGPCQGAFGSGYAFENNGKFYLGGIMSAMLYDLNGKCDASNYIVFTDTSKFESWINDNILNK